MDIKEFINKYVEKINYLLEKGKIMGRKDPDFLERGDYTFYFNCALYEIAVDNNLLLRIEESTGRGGFSDISIYDSDGKVKLLEIEHENNPTDKAIKKSVRNLLISKSLARNKLLITFWTEKYTKKEVLNKFLRYMNQFVSKDNNLWLLIAKEEFDGKEDFELYNNQGKLILNFK